MHILIGSSYFAPRPLIRFFLYINQACLKGFLLPLKGFLTIGRSGQLHRYAWGGSPSPWYAHQLPQIIRVASDC